MTILLGLLALVLAISGVPLFVVIATSALTAFAMAELDSSLVVIEMYRMANMPVLISIPLFAFSGYLMAESGSPQRLLRVSRALMGWMPGGLAMVALVTCAAFTALTGASGVTIIALGGLLYPALIAERYSERFSLGLITTSGSRGLLFPPSIPLILFAIVASVSVDDMFRGGLVPGLLMVSLMGVYGVFTGARGKTERTPFNFREAGAALWEAKWELPLPVIVLGSIFSGWLAVSEAAALTAFLVLLVEVVLYRDVKLRDLPRIVRECMVLVGGILIILGAALAYTNYLIDAEVPFQILETMESHVSGKIMFLLVLNIFLLIVGCMLDIFSALVVVVPLITPIALQYGIHPVHLGVIFLTNLEIGYSTPPVGLNLFISSFRFKKPIVRLYLAAIPFLIISLIGLILITYFPQLTLWLVE
jgi:tripartite ATP-independent transporter DctM subunit